MEPLHSATMSNQASSLLPPPFPSPPHHQQHNIHASHSVLVSSNNTPSRSSNGGQTPIVVETRLKKTPISFTAHFVGLSGFVPLGPSSTISSPIVEVNDLAWSVHLHLNNGPFLGCAIFLESPQTTARATYRISLVNQMGWKNHSIVSDTVRTVTNTGTIGAMNSSAMLCNETKFISREELKNAASGHCVDDTIIVLVELIVFSQEEKRILAAPPKPLAVNISIATKSQPSDERYYCPTLLDDMQCLLFNEEMSDVVIVIPPATISPDAFSPLVPQEAASEDPIEQDVSSLLGSEDSQHTIYAHSFVLKLRSPVFRAMLQSQMQESLTRRIVITEFSTESVRDLLSFLYTDTCAPLQALQSPSGSQAQIILTQRIEELLMLACKYDIARLQLLCEQQLVARMQVENVSGLLRLADDYQAVHLKQRALEFIACNASAVASHPEFFEQLSKELSCEVIRAMAGVRL